MQRPSAGVDVDAELPDSLAAASPGVSRPEYHRSRHVPDEHHVVRLRSWEGGHLVVLALSPDSPQKPHGGFGDGISKDSGSVLTELSGLGGSTPTGHPGRSDRARGYRTPLLR